MDDEVYRLHADVCKVMAHPRRLQIINALRAGEATLGELAQALAVPKATVSQLLSQMRQRGIVRRGRDGARGRDGPREHGVTGGCGSVTRASVPASVGV